VKFRRIRNFGYALLIGPAVGGVYTLLSTFNPAIYSLTLSLFSISLTLIILGYLGERGESSQVSMICSENEAQTRILELARKSETASIDVLTAGVVSRKTMIMKLIKDVKKPLRVLIQDPSVAVSEFEKSVTLKSINELSVEIGEKMWESQTVEFCTYKDRAVLRLVLFRDHADRPVHAVLGWYSYRNCNQAITGSRHPSVFISKAGAALLQFADSEFSQKKRNATNLPFENLGGIGPSSAGE
jgi:hypothetical protein